MVGIDRSGKKNKHVFNSSHPLIFKNQGSGLSSAASSCHKLFFLLQTPENFAQGAGSIALLSMWGMQSLSCLRAGGAWLGLGAAAPWGEVGVSEGCSQPFPALPSTSLPGRSALLLPSHRFPY